MSLARWIRYLPDGHNLRKDLRFCLINGILFVVQLPLLSFIIFKKLYNLSINRNIGLNGETEFQINIKVHFSFGPKLDAQHNVMSTLKLILKQGSLLESRQKNIATWIQYHFI